MKMRLKDNAEHVREMRAKNSKLRWQRIKASRLLGTHTEEQWEALKLEFGNRCVRCMSVPKYLEPDHIIPVYQGGSDAIENIQPLCAWCNSRKGPESINWVLVRRGEAIAENSHL